MKNNASENGRNLTAGVDLWNFGTDGTRNYSEINEVFAMHRISQRPLPDTLLSSIFHHSVVSMGNLL